MEIYAKGQLSFLILTCLLERDYYGLEIIDEIKKRSDGKICLKKPSVYSNLTRMEKQKQVSSYIQNSDLGPNRKYYSITEKGRATYISLKEYFDKNGIDAFKDFVENDASPMQEVSLPAAHSAQTPTDNEATNEEVKQDDFFDFSSIGKAEESHDDGRFLTDEDVKAYVQPKQEQPAPQQIESAPQEPIKEEQTTQNREKEADRFSIASLLRPTQEQKDEPGEQTQQKDEIIEQPAQEKQIVEDVQPAQVYIIQSQSPQPTQISEQQDKQLSNQEIYDISRDFSKYKRKRSFAEDQMAFEVQETAKVDEEKTKQNIEELKSALLENKNKYAVERNREEFKPKPAIETPIQQNDDGVFITGVSITREEAEKPRKIEPPRLKIIGEREPLPAPKKDKSIDISHKEIISQLYAKSKGGELGAYTNPDDAIYDYEDLQDYYKSQGVSFRVYEKSGHREKHNTNKLNFYASLVCMICSIVGSALLFTVLYLTKCTMAATNFLYIALPLISIAETGYRFYCYKNHTSWEPKPMLAAWIIWLIALFSLGAIMGLNFAFGATGKTILSFSNTIFYPMLLILIYLPLYYHLRKWLYVKFWK